MVWRKIAGGVVALALCLPLLVHAAGKSDGKLFGVRLGAQISNLMTDANWGPYPDISGPGGVFSVDFSHGFTDNFYLHTALGLDYRTFYAYGEIGIPCAALEGEESCGGYWEGYDVNSFFYLEIPVMAQWRTSALFLEAGPVVDILLRMNEDYILPEKYRNDRCYEDKRFGAGVVAGVGHMFDFGLSIDARVSFQFTDLVEGDKKCLTMHSEEVEMRFDPETEETTTRVLWESDEYMGGSYYKLLKYQIGIGYWF
ncbi:outer membrane beta-barrel protein [Fibrobacter sp. UBA3629]|uniref:outer membrane beta-barrel protein n=1 Tax=Fibrobacter sp. UBA3629 TaxID=1946530 RepID=UPI0025C0803F|nr:outer membrane beta-barrel protein [Fibrobacter sp. UBA3629]